MRNNKIKSLILLFTLILSSCKSAIIMTHNQSMNTYNTKEKVLARFGVPDSKTKEGNVEQWLYDYGTRSVTSVYNPNRTANTTANYNAYTNTVNVNTTVNSSNSFARTSTYKKYAKFLINESGNVISWNSQGVNLELVDKKQRLKNILYPTLIGFAIVAIILIIDEANFQKQLEDEEYYYWND